MDFSRLQKLLKRRLIVISDQKMREQRPDEQLRELQSLSESIDEWTLQHRTELPAKLRHFLENYSLQKALDYLLGEQGIERCGK